MTENMNKPTKKKINKEWGIEEERYRRTAPDAPGARRKFRKRDSLPIIFAIAVMAFVAVLGWHSSAKAEVITLNVRDWTYGDSPSIVFNDGGNTLSEGPTYSYTGTKRSGQEVSGEGVPTDAGVYILTVTYTIDAEGQTPQSVDSEQFSINPRTIVEGDVVLSGDQLVYTGEPLIQEVDVTVSGSSLVLDTDYTVANNEKEDAGDYTLTVSGKGNYVTATPISKEFSIDPAPLKIVSGITVADKEYDGEVDQSFCDICFRCKRY